MKNKHTPGPWKVSLADDAVVVNDLTDIIQERAKLDYEEHFEEYEANAELIADAPRLKAVNAEMLEALKEALKAINPPSNLSMHYWGKQLTDTSLKIKSIIAKAEGRD